MLTPLIASTAALAIVLAAALALLVLEYRGEEIVRRLWRSWGQSEARQTTITDDANRVPAETMNSAGAVLMRPLVAIEMLRILTGVVWLVNLVFIVDPAADYWSTFASVAQSYGPTTLGGPGLASFVSSNSGVFAWLIALLTVYLGAALTLGLTTRLASILGVVASIMFFVTQFGTTFLFPGGTDVGAHPLYIVIYATLWVGGAGQAWSIDGWLWRRGWGRRVPGSRWFASPAPLVH